MSTEAARKFYSSKRWIHCRKAYLSSVGGLCEVCLKKGIYKPAEIVHHKKPITDDTLNDPTITLSWGNLLVCCRQCHEEIHGNQYFLPDNRGPRRYNIAPDGSVTIMDQKPDGVRRNRKGEPIGSNKKTPPPV